MQPHEPLPLVPLAGSERPPLAEVGNPRPAAADAAVEVTLVLRRRQVPGSAPLLGANPADVEAVVDLMQQQGLTVLLADEQSRRVRLRGTVAQLAQVFGTAAVRGRRQRPGRVRSPTATAPAG